jgi:phosphate transport system ATP-binding protein
MNSPIFPDPLCAGALCAAPGSSCQDLRLEDLSLAYGSHRAFSHLDLTFPACRISAVVGPSGCGKSSLLSCLNRLDLLVPEATTNGRIWWHGRDLRADTHDIEMVRRRIGMIFQKPTPFPLSIAANLDIPLREHYRISRSERADRSERALRSVGLWNEVSDRLRTPAQQLSGGQQQRLCLARALVLEPEVLLMDEPCSALDPLASEIIEDLIANMRGFYTVILVTHDLAQARRLADQAILLWPGPQGGEVIRQGSPTDVLDCGYPADTRVDRYLGLSAWSEGPERLHLPQSLNTGCSIPG